MGPRLRDAVEHRRRLRPLSTREGRSSLRPRLDSDGARRRLPAAAEMSRLPIRLRLTLAFAVAMAAVLTAMSLLVYIRVADSLLASVDQTLRAQGREAAARAHDERSLVDPDAAAGRKLAQILTPDGRPVRSMPAGLPPLLGRVEARRVSRGTTLL